MAKRRLHDGTEVTPLTRAQAAAILEAGSYGVSVVPVSEGKRRGNKREGHRMDEVVTDMLYAYDLKTGKPVHDPKV